MFGFLFYFFTTSAAQLWEVKKKVFLPVLSLPRTTLIFKKELICTMYHTRVVFRLKKQRKENSALPVLMYGLIPSGSFHAICKCINKGNKAKAIYPTHNTQGQGIENFESTIDSCISRNYPRIRMNATTT